MFNWLRRRRQPQSERSTAGASSELLTTPIAEVRERYEVEARQREQQALKAAIAEKDRLERLEAERRGGDRTQVERRRPEPAYRRIDDDPVVPPYPAFEYEPGPSRSYSTGGHHHRDETSHTPSDPSPPSDFGGTSYSGE